MGDGIITREKMNEILEADEGIAAAAHVLLSISRDKAERARLMSEYKFETDHQSKVIQAERRGRAEGRKEATKEFISLLDSGKSIEEIKKQYSNEN